MKLREHYLFQRFAGWFSPFFSSKFNPLYHLADVAIFMLAIATVSGIYLFIFFNVDPLHSYDSVEKLSAQWVGGLMRSIHRYSSDLLVVFALMHLAHMLITGKFRRIISWITGVGSFLVVVFIGVTGYLLVWDEKAKMLGILTSKFLAALPIFDPSITGAFLLNDLPAIGGFFRVALFGHIFFTLFIVFILWLHVVPIASPKLILPKQAMLFTGSALLLACLIFPAKSDPPAQAVILPTQTTFDWYYFFGYYFMKILSPAGNWLLMFGSGIALAILPFVRRKKPLPKPKIDLGTCDGCDQCAKDCPYGAIDMLPQMGAPYNGAMKAILEPSKCVGCSICVGSCHVDAIAIASADFTQDEPSGKQDLVIYKCLYSVCETPAGISCHTREAPCIAGIHPGQIRKDLETGKATGVALVCCEDCFYRFGKDWQEKRLTRKRRPTFHRRAPLERVKIITTAQNITRELRQFVQELKTAAGGDSVDHLTVVEHKKLNPVLALAVTVVFFGLVPLLSNTNLGFYTTGEKTIIFDFKYVSSPTEFQQLQSGGAHMQSAQPIVKSRSTVKLNLYNAEKQLFYSKEFKPRGLRQDIAIFVFDEIKTNENQFDVELVETAFPERKLQLLSVQVNQKDGTVIVLKEGQFQKL